MTAKRFTVDDGLENVLCWEINDKENEDMTCGECAKLLNELHEENKKLRMSPRVESIELEALICENQQLKQENKQLRHQIETYKSGNALLKKTLDKEWK